MAAPVLVFCETNGAGAGSTTNNITTISFAAIDNNSIALPTVSTANPIAAGNNSYEKYIAMQVTTPSSNTLTAFSIYFPSAATSPTDGAGVSTTLTCKYGCVPHSSYAAPLAIISTVAGTSCSATTVAPGTSFAAPANTTSAYSGYFVQQLQVSPAATGGNVSFSAQFSTIQFTYSAIAFGLVAANVIHALASVVSSVLS